MPTVTPPQHPRVRLDATPPHDPALSGLLGGIRFGVIQLTVHNGRVVQIDRTERIRFTDPHDPGRKP